jgi:hypothetical protein
MRCLSQTSQSNACLRTITVLTVRSAGMRGELYSHIATPDSAPWNSGVSAHLDPQRPDRENSFARHIQLQRAKKLDHLRRISSLRLTDHDCRIWCPRSQHALSGNGQCVEDADDGRAQVRRAIEEGPPGMQHGGPSVISSMRAHEPDYLAWTRPIHVLRQPPCSAQQAKKSGFSRGDMLVRVDSFLA